VFDLDAQGYAEGGVEEGAKLVALDVRSAWMWVWVMPGVM
jgi:hypothetical protein